MIRMIQQQHVQKMTTDTAITAIITILMVLLVIEANGSEDDEVGRAEVVVRAVMILVTGGTVVTPVMVMAGTIVETEAMEQIY